MAPVVLEMDVDCYQCVEKIKKAVRNLRGVETVWVSPEQRRVVVYGTADAHAIRRRIERKMGVPVEIVSYGSAAPYYYSGARAAPHRPHAYDYYSQAPSPPPHAYYSYQPPPPPPARSYRYAARGYGAGWVDPDPYGYEAYRTVSSACSIM